MTLCVAIFRNFTIPENPPRIPNVAKCKWEKVYDAHLVENRAVNVAQLGLLGAASPSPFRACNSSEGWHFIIAKKRSWESEVEVQELDVMKSFQIKEKGESHQSKGEIRSAQSFSSWTYGALNTSR